MNCGGLSTICESSSIAESTICESSSIAENNQRTLLEHYISKEYIFGMTLGKSHSGSVMKCTKKSTGIQYALKIMPQRVAMNEALFKNERDILSVLKHPNIVTLHNTCVDMINYYIIYELCEGGALFDRIIDKNQPMTEKMISKLVRTMLLTLQYCHRLNVVHRDIKPENFVFKTKGQNSKIVLIDFGYALIAEDEREYKDLVGTPSYLSPESALSYRYSRNGAVLKASDIWAVGVISYILLTGRHPFKGNTTKEILSRIVNRPLYFPSKVEVSKSFADFCQQMLKKSPKSRMKLSEALAHPWLQSELSSDVEISGDVIRALRQFNKQSKLKKAITRELAEHMGEKSEEKLRSWFFELDKNNDGGIDLYELSLLLINLGYTETQAHKEAAKIMESTDLDRSGRIEFVEFAQTWQRKLLCVNESYIRAIFSALDEDDNGSIDADELMKLLGMNNEEDQDQIRDIIREVDTDGNGVLSFDEFRTAMLERNYIHTGSMNEGHTFDPNEILDLDI